MWEEKLGQLEVMLGAAASDLDAHGRVQYMDRKCLNHTRLKDVIATVIVQCLFPGKFGCDKPSKVREMPAL